MRKIILCITAALAVFAGGAAFATASISFPSKAPVTSVTGSYFKGFNETRADGTVHHLPSLAAALKVCKFETRDSLSRHYRESRRVQCFAATKAHYHDLAVLRDALNYAHSDHPSPPPSLPPHPTCNPPAGVAC